MRPLAVSEPTVRLFTMNVIRQEPFIAPSNNEQCAGEAVCLDLIIVVIVACGAIWSVLDGPRNVGEFEATGPPVVATL